MTKEEFADSVFQAEKSMYRVAKSILHQDEDCEDAIQSAILNAYEKLDTLRNEKFFKTWLTRILINECYKILRSSKEQIPFEPYMAEQNREKNSSDLYEKLMELDEKYRIPFVLFHVEGYSIQEIH